MTLKQSNFKQPIAEKGCLFLCYCYIADIQTDDEANEAFDFAVENGLVRESDCYNQLGPDAMVRKLCDRFGTSRIEGLTRKKVGDHWVVVDADGDEVYDPTYGI